MKRINFAFLLIIVSIFYSCKKDAGIFTLGVDVQSSFNRDSVKICIDGQEIINKQLQTNYALSLCPVDGQVVTMQNEGNHEIKVIVNNTVTKTENFQLRNNFYIGINYNQLKSEISFVYSKQPFQYD